MPHRKENLHENSIPYLADRVPRQRPCPASDGGKRKGGLGLSTASVAFRNQLVDLLEEFDINAKKDQWLNKLYNKNYYGLYFNKHTNDCAFLCTGRKVV